MDKIYWIGARESDVTDEEFITGSITRYGNNEDNNISFCQNGFTYSYDTFLAQTLHNILLTNPDALFLFANEAFAYKFGEKVFVKSICTNKLSIIESLNDKIFFRQFINKDVDVPPSIILNMYKDINYDFIKSIFSEEYDCFVLQTTNSAGGKGSLLLHNSSENQNLSKLAYPILVTPFIQNSIPINTHIAVSKNEIRVFPPSIQLIGNTLNYFGADFIKYQTLNKYMKDRLISQCYKLAKKIQTLGALGVFGVDILLSEEELYFIECNFRYQGSTFVLNQGLTENGFPSIHKIRYKCFYDTIHDIPDDIYNLQINYSSFRRTTANKRIKLPQPFAIKKDGNDISSSLRNGYIHYELFNASIFDYFEK